ncbi:OLC1v1023289C2 [Oldenlandia corymbosa var. corymbosa]|uniref:OLC1v1023289C2 n=1 Tax=Oldenlandia corymbosa var. corymbosa TaxID=529605 RepID=A0AAV1C202_OLDCO|nr:OLC1v1023289C2 [Oldenlandia corymbosa var. corymbosa]
MMSVERSFEAWEEVQRHGQDLADKLAQGFTGLIQSHITPPQFPWPNAQPPKLFEMEFPAQNFVKKDFGLAVDSSAINGVSAIFDIGNKIGQAGVDLGACVNGMVQQFFRRLPVPFRHDENVGVSLRSEANMPRNDIGITLGEDLGSLAERFRDYGYTDNKLVLDSTDEENGGTDAKASRLFGRSQGTINLTSTYESRTRTVESMLVARGDLWRVEASQGGTTSGSENSSLFLVQLGPVLFVRDSTLLLPIHLSKQHLLWYGYDRKHGMHSLCPAMWSKHRRWLLMSMICLNPMACSFMDLQFPNGQITYVAGEGVSTSAFLPLCGGLLQAQGQYPGEMRFSFSCKNKMGTCITPMVQWPDKSFSLGLAQSLAWKRSGLMVRPTVQFSLCPTIGGSNPGLQAELTHSLKEEVSLTCGCSLVARPTAFASLSVIYSYLFFFFPTPYNLLYKFLLCG